MGLKATRSVTLSKSQAMEKICEKTGQSAGRQGGCVLLLGETRSKGK
jgi:hypothetical protein